MRDLRAILGEVISDFSDCYSVVFKLVVLITISGFSPKR